jgi:hypothetical protein
MLLQYEIGIDTSKVRRQLAGVYGDFLTLQRRIDSASALGVRNVSRRAKQITDKTPTAVNGLSGRGALRRITDEERASIRAAQRAGNARLREIKREERERTRAFLAQRRQEEELAAMQRRLASRQGALRDKWRQERQERWGNVARGAVGGVRNLVGIGAGALGLGGSYLAMNAVSKQVQVGGVYSELANKAFGIQGDTRTREELMNSVATQSSELGMKSGFGGRAVAQGLSNLTGVAGKTKVGQALMPMLVDLADATGASLEDVGKTGGQVIQAMTTRGYSDPEIIKQTTQVLAAMAKQAQVGSIEFKDLAQNMGELMASTAGFDGNLGDLAETMGAVSQLAISGGASSGPEAMTALLRFRDDLIENAGRFEAQGVHVFSDKTKTRLRDPMAVIRETLTSTGGDLTKVGKLFGIRGAKALAPFQQASAEASRRAGGGAKGKAAGDAAVLALLDSIRGSTMRPEEIQASAEFRRKAPDKQFDILSERFNQAVGSKLLPVVTELIPKLEGLIPVAADVASKGANLVSWMAADPWNGVGLAASAGIAKELTSAGIATMLKGPFGQLAGQATALAAAFLAGKTAIDWVAKYLEDKQRAEIASSVKEQNAVSSATAGLRKDPGNIENWQDRVVLGTRAAKASAEAKRLRAGSSTWVPTGSGMGFMAHDAPSPEDLSKAKSLESEAASLNAKIQSDVAAYQMRAAKALEDAGKEIAKAAKGADKPSRGKPMIARPSS